MEWFFKNLTWEEENMLITEWNQDEALKVRFEEGLEQGREEARKLTFSLVNQAGSMEELKKMFETAFTATGAN